MCRAAAGNRQPRGDHRLLEQLAILGQLHDLDRRADQLHAPLREHARLVEIDREVERGLASNGRQQRVRALATDDVAHAFDSQRLDIRSVGNLGIGHDRGRIGVDQDDAVAFLAQRLAGLDTRIVELGSLADDDRAGAKDQDRVDVGTFRHKSPRCVLARR